MKKILGKILFDKNSYVYFGEILGGFGNAKETKTGGNNGSNIPLLGPWYLLSNTYSNNAFLSTKKNAETATW